MAKPMSKRKSKPKVDYKFCMNCGTDVRGALATAAADPNTIYCRITGDRLVNSRCPNPMCPLFNKPQFAAVSAKDIHEHRALPVAKRASSR